MRRIEVVSPAETRAVIPTICIPGTGEVWMLKITCDAPGGTVTVLGTTE